MHVKTVDREDEFYDREYRAGQREIRLIEEYDEGIQVKVVVLLPDFRDREIVGRELVAVPDGRIFVFRSSWNTPEIRTGRIFAKLFHELGGLEMRDDPEVIPTQVAVMGKPAIASYLHVVPGLRRREIAERLDVAPKTVQQYWHRFINGE